MKDEKCEWFRLRFTCGGTVPKGIIRKQKGIIEFQRRDLTREKRGKRKLAAEKKRVGKKTGLRGGLKTWPCKETINPRFVEIESRLIEAGVRADCTGPDNVAGPYIILNYIDATSVHCVYANACVYKDAPSTLKSLTVSGEKRLCRRIDNIRSSAGTTRCIHLRPVTDFQSCANEK